MRQKAKILIFIVLVLVAAFFYSLAKKDAKNNKVSPEAVKNEALQNFVNDTQTQTQTQSAITSTSSTAVQTPKAPSLVEASPYMDFVSKFSINLPVGWGLLSKTGSNKSTSTSFYNISSSKTDPDAKIVIERFVRTEGMNKTIEEMGEDGVLYALADSLKADLGLVVATTEKITINGASYVHMSGTYVGKTSTKEVVQHVYFAMKPDAYYRVGMDAYTDVWLKNKDAMFQSLNTLVLK